MSTPKFYVGQKVVAVRDHSELEFKKGDVFTIKEVKEGCCVECSFVVSLNEIKSQLSISTCTDCGFEEITYDAFYSETCFAPIIEKFKSITFEKVMEKELTSAN